jgi:hypothetical protein
LKLLFHSPEAALSRIRKRWGWRKMGGNTRRTTLVIVPNFFFPESMKRAMGFTDGGGDGGVGGVGGGGVVFASLGYGVLYNWPDMEHWPPDAARGFDLPPAEATTIEIPAAAMARRPMMMTMKGCFSKRISRNETKMQKDSALFEVLDRIVGEAGGDDHDWWGVGDDSEAGTEGGGGGGRRRGGVVYSAAPLLLFPMVDFSMPFNVMTLNR